MSTLTRDHIPATLATTERERMLNSMFTTALEGGIGYWARCSVYRWGIRGENGRLDEAIDFVAVIHEMGDEDDEDAAPVHVVDADVIRKGIRRMIQRGGWNQYISASLGDLIGGPYDDHDYDSITAGLVVQFGLFGEERYS
jgi:hypothetical protein